MKPLRPSLSPKLPLRRYFSDEFTEVKLPFRVVPMPLTAAMITKAIPLAIRQYSMAVAPDWSLMNLEKSGRIQNSCRRATGSSRANIRCNLNWIVMMLHLKKLIIR